MKKILRIIVDKSDVSFNDEKVIKTICTNESTDVLLLVVGVSDTDSYFVPQIYAKGFVADESASNLIVKYW